jgi:hypothetical protein
MAKDKRLTFINNIKIKTYKENVARRKLWMEKTWLVREQGLHPHSLPPLQEKIKHIYID